jgi:glucokinase
MIALGVDIGGTGSRAGAVDIDRLDQSRDRKGAINSYVFAFHSVSTPRDEHGQALIDWVVGIIRAILAERSIDSAPLGLALPGPVDHESGVLLRSVNLPFLENRPIRDELSERTCQRVTLCTDAEAAAWGEYAVLDPRPSAFAHLRIGTGVACGLIVDGEAVEPRRTRGGHLDVLVVDHSPGAAPCPCGKRGCLETLASGPALSADDQPQERLQHEYERGEPTARERIRFAARALHEAVRNIQREHGCHCFVLGGGVIERLPALYDELSDWMSTGTHSETLMVERSRLGDSAGVIGAALLAARDAGND